MARTVARLLAESLEAHDVDQVFCVPGESYIGLTNALSDMNSIRVVVCRHEGGAGFMAVADGRMRPRAGVCMVSRGPGMSNAMVAMHSAFHDATPLVMLVGQVERKDYGRQALQEQNYSKMLADVTKAVIDVNEPEQASEAIARAFHLAESGTPGPVAVILPEDIFDETTEAEINLPRPRAMAGPRPEDLDRLAQMLAKSERPLLLVGGELVHDSLYDPAVTDDLRQLAESWVLPVNPTHRRPQLFDAAHANYGGYMGIRVPPALISEMRKADLMVCLGERMTDSVSQSYTFPSAPQPQLPFVHVWPDPNEIGRVWRPELGMACSPYEVIKGLLARTPPADGAKRRGWVDGLHAIHRKLLAKTWEPTTDGSYLHRYLTFRPGQLFLSSVVGAMGSGMPMGVAASLRRPGKQVVAFMGDGGALMAGNEIATAFQYGATPIIVISDNSMYGTIGMHTHVRYPGRPIMNSNRLTNPDFAAWGRSFGAEGITIEAEADVGPAIAAAFAVKTKPVVVHCKTSAIQMSAWRRYDLAETLP